MFLPHFIRFFSALVLPGCVSSKWVWALAGHMLGNFCSTARAPSRHPIPHTLYSYIYFPIIVVLDWADESILSMDDGFIIAHNFSI